MTKDRQVRRDTEKVVRKVLRLVEKYDSIGQEEFSAINLKVMECVSKHTGIELQQINEVKSTVIRDLPREYGQIDAEMKSWDALIAYMYMKYLKELGVLE